MSRYLTPTREGPRTRGPRRTRCASATYVPYTETGIAGLNINLFGIGEQFWTPPNKGYVVICSDPKGEPNNGFFLRMNSCTLFPGGLSDALCCTGGYAKMLHLDSGLIPLPPARRAKSPLSSHGGVIEPNTLFF